jgi:hypothetical protein
MDMDIHVDTDMDIHGPLDLENNLDNDVNMDVKEFYSNKKYTYWDSK